MRTAADHVCSMLWSSIAGWHNRPDYFDQNTLVLLGDLAFLAGMPEAPELLAALEADSIDDCYELGWKLQKPSEAVNLYALLKRPEVNERLMASLAPYEKYRLEVPP